MAKNIGELVLIHKGQYSMIGFVIKAYSQGNLFVRSLCDNFPLNLKRGWNRYGIGSTEGYYVSLEDLKDPFTTITDVNNMYPKYYERVVTVNNKQKSISNSELLQTSSVEQTSDEVRIWKILPANPVETVTFVYFPHKDIGAFAKGITDESKLLATRRAQLKYMKDEIKRLEKEVN